MIGMSVSDEEMTVRELMEKGGPGYAENAFVSSYLRNAVINTGADIDLATSSWNLLLKRLGFTKWPETSQVQWGNRDHLDETNGPRRHRGGYQCAERDTH